MTQPTQAAQPAAEPHRDPTSGRWLCNAAPDCTNPAAVQWAAPDEPDSTVPVYACTDHAPTA